MTTGSQAPRSVQARSVDTRARILDAAVQALVEDGYPGATTVRIQQLANVSRGRLLHHYPSREALLVAAVAHLTEVQTSALAKDATWSTDLRERAEQAVETIWEAFSEPYFWASIELWVAARVNRYLRDALVPHERKLGVFIRTKADTFFGPELVARQHYVATRELLIGSMRGVALTYAFLPRDFAADPHLPYWRSIVIDQLFEPAEPPVG